MMPLWLSQSGVKLQAGQSMNADTSQAKLHDAGWSVGEIAVRTPAGAVWMVYCHRGDQRIVAKASNQEDAWREAAEMVKRLE
jgi:hypothetical protein